MMSPDNVPHAAQPAAPTLPDMRFCDTQDSNNDALFSQILETPEIWNLLSEFSSNLPDGFEPVPDVYPTIGTSDVNFNANLYPNSYQQNFSQYSDMEFSMLVNESQIPQSEPQDPMVLVKTEEEL